MGWKNERDLLIAQTMAFVQSVIGQKPDAGLGVDAMSPVQPDREAAPAAEAAPLDVAEIYAAEIIAAPVTPPTEDQINGPIPRKIVSGDFRSEMQARVANFRAHQERFHREREEYFSTTLTRLRAAIENTSSPDPSDRAPPRR